MSLRRDFGIAADFIALGDTDLLATAHAEFGGARGLLLDPKQVHAQLLADGDLHWPLQLARNDWPAACVRFACASMRALPVGSGDELLDYLALMIGCANDMLLITGVSDAASVPWQRPRALLGVFAALGLHDASVLRLADNSIVLQIRLLAGKGLRDLATAPSVRGVATGVHLDAYADGVLSGWLELPDEDAGDEYTLRHRDRVLARLSLQAARMDVLMSGHYAARNFAVAVDSSLPAWDELSVVDGAGRTLPRLDLRQPDARGRWLAWDGERLQVRIDPQALPSGKVELHVDGAVFQRIDLDHAQTIADSNMRVLDFRFPWSPTGRRELKFVLLEPLASTPQIGQPWRVHHGEAATEPGVDRWHHASRSLAPVSDSTLLPQHIRMPGITSTGIIIPVYNSPQIVQRCIEAVLRWTHGQASLIIVDDGSTDPEIGALLERYAGRERVLIHRSVQNQGYTHSVNLGIRYAAGADVVLLNSDTEVGPHWLQSLRHAAYAADDIGTVTAVSDNAGAFSVPELEQPCPIPAHWDLPMTQRALLQQAGMRHASMPTGNGFCMFVKRAVFAHVGEFDERAFPAGYGEENDLCQRAQAGGFRHIVAGNVLVHHERSVSFGDERRFELGKRGMAVLRHRYPDYEISVQSALHSFERRVLDYRVRRTYADTDARHAHFPPRPRILMITSGADDAATHAAGALCRAMNERYECFLLRWDGERLGLYRQDGETLELECSSEIERCNEFAQSTWHTYESKVRDWLALYAIELVHIHHLGWHSLRLPDIISALEIPIVYTFYDFHVVCPSTQLRDEAQQFCGGRCTMGEGHCKAVYAVSADYPVLKHHYSRRWKQEKRGLLAPVAAFTAISSDVAEVLLANHPWLADREFQVLSPPPPENADIAPIGRLALDYARLYRLCWSRQASFRSTKPAPSIPLLAVQSVHAIPALTQALRHAVAAQALDVLRLNDTDSVVAEGQAMMMGMTVPESDGQSPMQILVDTDAARLRAGMEKIPSTVGVLFSADKGVAVADDLLVCDPDDLPLFNARALTAFVINCLCRTSPPDAP